MYEPINGLNSATIEIEAAVRDAAYFKLNLYGLPEQNPLLKAQISELEVFIEIAKSLLKSAETNKDLLLRLHKTLNSIQHKAEIIRQNFAELDQVCGSAFSDLTKQQQPSRYGENGQSGCDQDGRSGGGHRAVIH